MLRVTIEAGCRNSGCVCKKLYDECSQLSRTGGLFCCPSDVRCKSSINSLSLSCIAVALTSTSNRKLEGSNDHTTNWLSLLPRTSCRWLVDPLYLWQFWLVVLIAVLIVVRKRRFDICYKFCAPFIYIMHAFSCIQIPALLTYWAVQWNCITAKLLVWKYILCPRLTLINAWWYY